MTELPQASGSLVQHVARNIESHRLFAHGEKILLGVSGGVDSMVLLHILNSLAPKHGWKLAVAHLNHRLRGRSSAADEHLVIRTARAMGLKVLTEACEVAAVARKQKISLEMAGRKLRHEFFARSAAKLRLKTLALAHHGDDQVELFFLRLFRGTGTDGLTGMKWTSVLKRAPSLRIVRPLLNEFKSALIQFAKTEHIAYREDASNLEPEFQRNRLRTELLPLLKRDYQPALNTVILRFMELTAAETHYLDAVAKEWLQTGKRRHFDQLHVAIQRRVLQLQLLSNGILPNYDLIEQLRLTPNHPECIDHRRVLEGGLEQIFETGEPFAIARAPNGMVYVQRTELAAFNSSSKSLKLVKPRGTASFGGLSLTWNYSKSCKLAENNPGVECFDAQKIGPAITLRHWQPGDRFQPIGMKTSIKLQDIFTNQKMPRYARHSVVVATNQQGMIFWVEGLRISETCKITEATRKVLRWKWKRQFDAV